MSENQVQLDQNNQESNGGTDRKTLVYDLVTHDPFYICSLLYYMFCR